MLTGEVSARLTAQSLVTTGFSVYRNVWPDTPDKVIALFETGGIGPSLFFSGATVEQPGLQVRVRGAARDGDAPRLQIERIFQAAIGWGGFTASGVKYLGFEAIQAPFLMGRDGNERVEWAVNFVVRKELSPTS